MVVVLLSVVIMMVVVGIMSIGVLMGRGPIKGSCGGMSALGMKTACDICGGTPESCENNSRQNKSDSADLAYEAGNSKTSTRV